MQERADQRTPEQTAYDRRRRGITLLVIGVLAAVWGWAALGDDSASPVFGGALMAVAAALVIVGGTLVQKRRP